MKIISLTPLSNLNNSKSTAQRIGYQQLQAASPFLRSPRKTALVSLREGNLLSQQDLNLSSLEAQATTSTVSFLTEESTSLASLIASLKELLTENRNFEF